MAATTPNLPDAACHIQPLPNELLESILLYAVSHFNPPGMDEDGYLRNIRRQAHRLFWTFASRVKTSGTHPIGHLQRLLERPSTTYDQR